MTLDPTLRLLKQLGLMTIAMFGTLVAAVRRARPGEYVGVDHPSGELRLRLEPDGRFSLRLAVWDAVVGEFVSQRELTGEWRERAGELELRAPDRQVVYSPAPRAERGWVWRRSSLPTFADGVALLAERRTPSLARKAANARTDRRRFV